MTGRQLQTVEEAEPGMRRAVLGVKRYVAGRLAASLHTQGEERRLNDLCALDPRHEPAGPVPEVRRNSSKNPAP